MTVPDIYEDCERCGERYTDEFINAYLRDEEQWNGEVLRVCCPPTQREDEEKV